MNALFSSRDLLQALFKHLDVRDASAVCRCNLMCSIVGRAEMAKEPLAELVATYKKIKTGLEPFPYNGVSSSFDICVLAIGTCNHIRESWISHADAKHNRERLGVELYKLVRNIYKIPLRYPDWSSYALFMLPDDLSLYSVPMKYRDSVLCRKYVRDSGLNLDSVPEEVVDAEMCLTAVCMYPSAIKYVPERLRTRELCELAFALSAETYKYVDLETVKVSPYAEVVRVYPDYITKMDPSMLTFAICTIAVRIKPILILALEPKYYCNTDLQAVALHRQREYEADPTIINLGHYKVLKSAFALMTTTTEPTTH